MAGLVVTLGWLTAVVFAAIKLTATAGGPFTAWCGWAAVLLVAVLGCLSAFVNWNTRP